MAFIIWCFLAHQLGGNSQWGSYTFYNTGGWSPAHWSISLREPCPSQHSSGTWVAPLIVCDQVFMRVVLPRLKAAESSVNFSNGTTNNFFFEVMSSSLNNISKQDAAPHCLWTSNQHVWGYHLTRTTLHLFLSFILYSFFTYFFNVINALNTRSRNLHRFLSVQCNILIYRHNA